MSVLRPLKSFINMFERLFRMLVSGLVILFPVVHGERARPVHGIRQLFGANSFGVVVRMLAYRSILEALDPSNCPVMDTRDTAVP
jgi:hypothetical protein